MAKKERDPTYLYTYRADPTGKFGGKDRLETQPTTLDKAQMQPILRAMAYLRDKYNLPHIDPRTLAAIALKEGRADFGINPPNKVRSNNKFQLMPGSQDLLAQVYKSPEFLGTSPTESFSGRVFKSSKTGEVYDFDRALRASELMQKAQRLGKDVTQLWNPGEKHYHDDVRNRAYAAESPKNQELLNSIYKYLGVPREKPASNTAENVPVEMPEGFRAGGRVRII